MKYLKPDGNGGFLIYTVGEWYKIGGGGNNGPSDEQLAADGWTLYVPPSPSAFQRVVAQFPEDVVLVDGVYTLPIDDLPTAAVESMLIDFTKGEANRRILAILPEWKQRNYTARAVEIQEIRHAVGSLTAEESDELAAIWSAFKDDIKPIRDVSDLIEAEILAGNITEYEGVTASDIWP